MCNIDISITIHTPELATALTKLADALSTISAGSAPATASSQAASRPSSTATSAPKSASSATTTPKSAGVPATSAPPTSAKPPVQPAPTAAPSPYTFPQLQQAAGTLVQAGRQQELCNLLNQKYKVQALTQLTEAQYGAFATDLRAMGVNI